MKRLTIVVAVAALAGAAYAQTPVGPVLPVATPVQHAGTYHLATGELVPGPGGGQDGGVVVYDNTAFNGSFFQPGPGLINMDFGTLSAGGNNQVTSIQIGYATTTLFATDVIVRIHAGAGGFCDFGAPVIGVLLEDLPGSSFGEAAAFSLDLDLAGSGLDAYVGDGPVGYSYEFLDANTGPLLCGPPNEAGVIDAFDQYDSSGTTCFGTFNFGGSAMASFYMQMTGAEPPECFLVMSPGVQPGVGTFQGAGHEFTTQIGTPEQWWPVTLEEGPEWVVADPPATLRASTTGVNPSGLSGHVTGPVQPLADAWFFQAQVLMWNPQAFPSQPEMSTPGLSVMVLADGRVLAEPFGQSVGGMQLWAETYWNDQGQKVLRLPFSIPGF